jgi:hypothetical protein
MDHGGSGGRCLRTLMIGVLLSLISAPAALPGEWEKMRENYDNTLRAYEKRIGEIEARERGVPADREQRAERITRDRVAGIRASLKESGKGKSLAEAADKASGDAKARVDLYREQTVYLDIVMSEWGPEGAERKKLREAMAMLQKNLERTSANLARAAGATTMHVEASDVLEKMARIEAAASEAGERLRARWQLERAAREREREQREREAAARARGVR